MKELTMIAWLYKNTPAELLLKCPRIVLRHYYFTNDSILNRTTVFI
jgi:hypothetical protein